jgi:hypothetical protein
VRRRTFITPMLADRRRRRRTYRVATRLPRECCAAASSAVGGNSTMTRSRWPALRTGQPSGTAGVKVSTHNVACARRAPRQLDR